ncbi:MAG: sensor histidine kinase [Anaerolineae bacterium]
MHNHDPVGLPIREARRMFLLTLGVRTVLSVAAYLATLAFTPVAPRVLALIVAFTLLEGGITLMPWRGRPPGGPQLAIGLSVDISVVTLRNLMVMAQALVAGSPLSPDLAQRVLVEPFVFLLVPLVLLAWTFGRRGALLGSAWAALMELGNMFLVSSPDALTHPQVVSFIGRVGLAFGITLIVASLAERERRHLTELEAAHRRLQRHAATVEQLAVSRERNRIARDLHDTLAHSLAALSVQLEALRTLLAHDPAAAQGLADQAVQIARDGLGESRQAIQALRADPLASMGLAEALRAEVAAVEARSGVHTYFIAAGQTIELEEEEAQTLYRIAQEALANAERHANAREIALRIAFASDSTELVVRDDGLGFDPAQVADDRYGITGMRERAALIGADLQIQSGVGGGTLVRCTLKR